MQGRTGAYPGIQIHRLSDRVKEERKGRENKSVIYGEHLLLYNKALNRTPHTRGKCIFKMTSILNNDVKSPCCYCPVSECQKNTTEMGGWECNLKE